MIAARCSGVLSDGHLPEQPSHWALAPEPAAATVGSRPATVRHHLNFRSAWVDRVVLRRAQKGRGRACSIFGCSAFSGLHAVPGAPWSFLGRDGPRRQCDLRGGSTVARRHPGRVGRAARLRASWKPDSGEVPVLHCGAGRPDGRSMRPRASRRPAPGGVAFLEVAVPVASLGGRAACRCGVRKGLCDQSAGTQAHRAGVRLGEDERWPAQAAGGGSSEGAGWADSFLDACWNVGARVAVPGRASGDGRHLRGRVIPRGHRRGAMPGWCGWQADTRILACSSIVFLSNTSHQLRCTAEAE